MKLLKKDFLFLSCLFSFNDIFEGEFKFLSTMKQTGDHWGKGLDVGEHNVRLVNMVPKTVLCDAKTFG